MPMPEIAKQVGERITYVPHVAKVSAHSKYNEYGFALDGLDGYWSLSPSVTDTGPLKGRPPVGTVALWTLQTAPKRGENAKPGSMYRDVIKAEKVPDGYVAPAVTAADPNAPSWTGGKDDPEAQAAIAQDAKVQAVSAYDDREARTRISIEQQVAFKGYAEVVTALATTKTVPAWLMPDGTSVVAVIVEDFMRLGAVLSHLPPMPAKPEEPDAQ